MTLRTFGEEGTVWGGGETYIEMLPREWYPVASGTIIQNQGTRPILVSTNPPTTIPYPAKTYDPESQYARVKDSLQDSPLVTWPSPHFREEFTVYKVLPHEVRVIGTDAFIMSATYRLQPISTNIFAALGEAEEITPPIPTCVDFEETYLVDITDGIDVRKETCLMSDGTIQIEYYKEGILVAESPNFSASRSQIDVEKAMKVATNMTTGLIQEVEMRSVFRNGELDPADITFWDVNVVPPVDMTATVSAAPFELANEAKSVLLGTESLLVSGTTGNGFDSIPANAEYATVYIDAGETDAGIRWTVDGSAPTDGNGEQENMGSTIHLGSAAQLASFRAVPIDGAGEIDGALAANLTVTFWNKDQRG